MPGMLVQSSFSAALWAARESGGWGVVPADNTFVHVLARPWSLRPIATRAYPEGERPGTRDLDSTASVQGRRHGEGEIPTLWRPDTGGLFILAALGSEVVSADPVGAATRKKHVVTCTDEPPSLTIREFNGQHDPDTDEDIAREHPGMLLDRMRIQWDANDDVGLLALTYTFIGQFGQEIELPTFAPSTYTAQANWKVAITRDSVSYDRLRAIDMTFENGVQRIKTGAGSADDQGGVFGGRRLSGTMTFVYQDETEFRDFLSSVSEDWVLTFTDENLIETVSSTPYYGGLKIEMPKVTPSEYERTADGAFYIQNVGFRAFHDNTLGGPTRMTVYNGRGAY